MRAAVLAILTPLFAMSAVAEPAPHPAVKGEAPAAAAPVPGRNSFTAGEAQRRMEKLGFALTRAPVKDPSGIWHGEGRRQDGSPVRLMLDYQGNVFVAQPAKMPVRGDTALDADHARALMAKRGYNVTSIPIKDDQGIWYAEGRLNQDQPVQVMVDREGNVFESGEYAGHPNSAPGAPPGPENPVRPAPPPETAPR